jgi:hypothetical protein
MSLRSQTMSVLTDEEFLTLQQTVSANIYILTVEKLQLSL